MEIAVYFQEMWQLASQGQTQGIWFWAAIYVFVLCIYSLIFQIRTRYWPSTQGELAQLGLERFGAKEWVKSDQEYVSKALYKYTVAGKTYEGSRISPWVFVVSHNARRVLKQQASSVQRSPDGGVQVFYNPNKPGKSYLIIAGKTGICITLLVSVIPLISFYCKYHALL